MRWLPALLLPCLVAAQTAEIRGRAVDEHGAPLAGVAVCQAPYGLPFVTAELPVVARTDRDGRFAVPSRSDDAPMNLLLVADGRVVVCAGAYPAMQPLVLPPARVLAGRVRDADGEPVAGAHVEASDWLAAAEFLSGEGRIHFPRPLTGVRTDAGGRFVLKGTCDTAMLVAITGDGIEPLLLGPVDAADPLDVEVRRFEPVELLVVDAAGEPIAGANVGWHAARQPLYRMGSWTGRTDAAGRCRAPVPDVQGVDVSSMDGEVPRYTSMKVAAGQRQLRVQLRPQGPLWPQPSGERLRVVVRDPLDRPVPAFRVALFGRSQLDAGSDLAGLWPGFGAAAGDGEDGVAEVQVVGKDSRRLAVLVSAAGFARSATVQDAGDELRVVLAPEAAIAGIVVDAKSGLPVAGARVWTLPKVDPVQARVFALMGFSFLEPKHDVVVTGADGRFRCGRLPAGERSLLCIAEGQGTVMPQTLACEPGKRIDGVRIEAPPLLTLAGRTDCKRPPPGACVRLLPHHPDVSTSSEDGDYSRTFPLADDGGFTATGVEPGEYEVQLLVCGGFRAGPPAKLPTDRIRVAADRALLDVQVAQALPGRVHGRITGNVPPQRLGVVSIAEARPGQASYGYLRYDGPTTAVARDGSYELLEPPARRTLVVFDLWTGAMLLRRPYEGVAPGEERSVDLEVQAAAVDVELGGAGFSASMPYLLEIRPKGPAWPRGVGALHDYSELPCGMGCRPAPGQRQLRLFLADGRYELRLRRQQDERREGAACLGAQLTIEAGQPQQLTLSIPAGK